MGIIVDVRVFNRHGIEKDERSTAIERAEIEKIQEDKVVEEEILERNIKVRAQEILDSRKLIKDFKKFKSGYKIKSSDLDEVKLNEYWKIELDDKQASDDLQILKQQYTKVKQGIKEGFEDKVEKNTTRR